MKKIITAILGLIILAAALPVINGILMKQVVRNVFDNANSMYEETGTGYSLEIIRYDRGLFSSQINWKMHLGPLKSLYGIEEIVFTDNAKHGFAGVVTTTDLSGNNWFDTFIQEKLQGTNPLTITTAYSLFGAIESTCSTQPFSFEIEKDTIEVESGSFTVTTDRDLKHFVSSGKWAGLSVPGKIEVAESSFASDLEVISTFIWQGGSSFSIGKVSVEEGDRKLDISDMKVSYTLDLDEQKNKISADSTVGINQVSTLQNTIDGITGRIAVSSMDAIGYEEFMTQYIAIVSAALSAVAESDLEQGEVNEELEQQMTAAGLQMMAAYEKLMTKDLEVTVSDVLIALPEGDIKGDVTVKLLQDMTLMQFAPVVGQPDLLLDILYLKSAISFPASLAANNQMLVTPLLPEMQTGLFVQEGNMLRHTAETKDKTLFVNGKVVNLAR